MPQIRYFHRGRYFRPSKPLHFLPPLKLTTGATHQPFPEDDGTCKKTSTRGRGRDQKHSRYRKMVMTLSNYLTLGNVADMKFLCRDHVRPPQIVDEVTSARHLLALLENQRLLAENSLYFLQTLLYYIARPDLYQIVLEFRADRQDDYKEKGVDIVDQYQVNLDEDAKRLKLASELLKFRKDLKPRRRLNDLDVNGMKHRLNDLSTKMKDNLKIMQRPNTPKHTYDDTTDVDSVIEDTARQEHGAHDHQTTSRIQRNSHKKSSPKLAPVKSYTRSDLKITKPIKTESARKSPKASETSQNQTEQITGSQSGQELEHSPTEQSKDEDYYTEEEEEISIDTFGYETPCPPPRENALGVNGVKVYDDVTIELVTKLPNVKVPNPSSLDQVTRRIHKLRHQSKELRNPSLGQVKRKKKKVNNARTSESGLNTSKADVESNVSGKDDVKLPDIYDKYARQKAVLY